jgi:hypothetical protein
LLEERSRELRSYCRAWPKRWRESLNPWGRDVQVNCWVWWVMGSVHVKANKGCKEGCKGMVKKASLRPRTEKAEVWGGIWERRVYWSGTTR